MKKKPTRSALRRRSRPERERGEPAFAARILSELERAGEPLTAKDLGKRLRFSGREKQLIERTVAELERAGEVVRNRAGALLVAKRIDVLAGRIEGHPDGHGFLRPDDGSPQVFLPP